MVPQQDRVVSQQDKLTMSTTDGPSPPADPSTPFLRANRVSLVALVVAVVLTVTVLLTVPHGRGVSSLWVMLLMLSPFAAATVAIGWLDVAWAQRLRLHLILPPACFLAFFCYFVPRQFYFGGLGDDFDGLYFTTLMLVPFVILSLVLCLRLGGARTSVVVRLAVAMLLLQLSGIEDLAFLTVNDLSGTAFSPIPEVWTWADHMAVRLGHYPTRTEAFAFIAVHVALAVTVVALPDRAWRALARLPRRRPARSDA